MAFLSTLTSLKVLHEITACIYKQGDEKPAMKWSFLHKLVTESLASLMKELKACGVDERAKELGIQKFKMKLLYKRMIAEQDFPRGRIFAIDTQDQYELALPLLQDKHELIRK